MFREAFEKLDPAMVSTILNHISPLIHGTIFDPAETVIMGIDMPFYPGYRLLDIADYSNLPPSRRYAVYHPDHAVILNFTNEPIYALNHRLSIKLSDETVADYIRFFFSFVRGKHGRFIIVENIDDIPWKDDPPPSARKAIGKMVRPITLLKKNETGAYEFEATMTFKNSLFKSNIVVTPDGHIELSNEELLVEDMPVLDDTLGQ